MKKIHLFFFRGLSTYGQDNAKWSVFDYGPIHQHFERAFVERGFEFHPILGMGAGPLEVVTGRAVEFLRAHPAWMDSSADVHWLGHSAGGLITRLALTRTERKPRSLVTLATPNAGSRLAQICLDMPKQYPGSARLLRAFAYNVASKRNFFEELTPSAVHAKFNFPSQAGVRVASVICATPRHELCWPLQLFKKIKAFADFDEPSDGLIERSTQPLGEVIDELDIDHFRQVGLFGDGRRFERQIDVLADFFRRV